MDYSIVIPVYNEDEAIPILVQSINNAMQQSNKSYEIIIVDDGSLDSSLETLAHIQEPNLTAVSLTTHLGKSAALQVGFDNANGKIIITMDGDLQDDPNDIPLLINKLNEGFDVVIGWRYKRKDPINKIIASKIANAFRKVLFKETIHDVGCNFRIIKKTVLKNIYLSGGLHRFFTLIVKNLGYKISEIKVNHKPRPFNRSKYKNTDRLIEGIKDLLRLYKYDLSTLMKPTKSRYSYKIIKKNINTDA